MKAKKPKPRLKKLPVLWTGSLGGWVCGGPVAPRKLSLIEMLQALPKRGKRR